MLMAGLRVFEGGIACKESKFGWLRCTYTFLFEQLHAVATTKGCRASICLRWRLPQSEASLTTILIQELLKELEFPSCHSSTSVVVVVVVAIARLGTANLLECFACGIHRVLLTYIVHVPQL